MRKLAAANTIPRSARMQCVARRIVDRQVLRLIKMGLKAPVEEREGSGTRRLSPRLAICT